MGLDDQDIGRKRLASFDLHCAPDPLGPFVMVIVAIRSCNKHTRIYKDRDLMKRIWLRTAGHGRLFEPAWSWENSLPALVLRARL